MSFMNLSEIAVKQRSVTLFFLILSLLAGAFAFKSLGRAEDPAFTVRVMMVSAQWPGASTELMQHQVVDKLEKSIQEVPDLKAVITTIRPGATYIQIEFEEFVSSDQLSDRFYQVRRRMYDIQSELPVGVMGPYVNEDFSDVYFSMLAVTSENLTHRELLPEVEVIRDRLQRVMGTKKAIIFGERSQKLFIRLNVPKLQRLGLAFADVINQVNQFNEVLPAGSIETVGPTIRVRITNDLSDPEQLAAVPLSVGEQQLKLGDIATIEYGYQDPPTQIMRAFGEDAFIIGVVMADGFNGQEFGENLAGFVEHQQSLLASSGIKLRTLTNQADAINQAVDLFQFKFLIALVVVMIATIFAIGLRAGIVVGIAIPATLGLTFVVMLSMGMNLDRITLGALILSLGLLVDDAIIAIEMMIVKMEQGIDRIQAASYAWNITAAPMLFGTLVTLAGFVPIGFARSGVGEYAGNIFWVLGISLIISWLVAVVFTPYLGVKMLPNLAGHAHDHEQSHKRLRRLVNWCVNHRKSVVTATVAMLVLSIAGMAGPVQKQFFPTSDRPEVMISVLMPEGTSFNVTNQAMLRLEQIAAQAEGVKSYSSYIGAGAPRFFISANPEQPSSAFAKLIIVSENLEARENIIAQYQQVVDAGEFTQARIRVERLLYGPPVNWPVAFRVVGPEKETIEKIAHQVRDIMAAHPNTVEPHLEWGEQVPTMKVDFIPAKLDQYGFTPSSVAHQLNLYTQGEVIGSVRDGTRSVQVIARSGSMHLNHDIYPTEPHDWYTIELKNNRGELISIGQLADISVMYEDPVIKRYNRALSIPVNTDIIGAQAKDVTADLWQDMADLRASLPLDYEIQISGAEEQSAKAEASIQALQPLMLAFMLIFVMLQMRSFTGTFMVVVTAPLGLIGAVIALLLFNQPFGFVATLGLIGLAGILMRNTLILTQQVADNINEGMDDKKAVIEAAVQRARPVILTAFAAVLAFIPLTLDSFWGPLAFVLIGGISVGTVVTLLFVPALYAMWYRVN